MIDEASVKALERVRDAITRVPKLGGAGAIYEAELLSVLRDAEAALEAAQVPATDDEREALEAVIEMSHARWVTTSRPFSSWMPLNEHIADDVLGAGFRRSSRVPVSRDELRRIVLEQLDRKDGYARIARSVVIVDALLATHDIYPKADRKATDSSNGDDRG